MYKTQKSGHANPPNIDTAKSKFAICPNYATFRELRDRLAVSLSNGFGDFHRCQRAYRLLCPLLFVSCAFSWQFRSLVIGDLVFVNSRNSVKSLFITLHYSEFTIRAPAGKIISVATPFTATSCGH